MFRSGFLLLLFTALYAHATSVVDQGPYVSEYYYHCPATAMTAAQSRTACQGFGNGWDIATIPTVASQNAIISLTPQTGAYSAWVGLSDDALEGTWLNLAGRLSNKIYFVGGACASIDYNPFNLPGRSTIFSTCWWAAGEPNNANTEVSPHENCATTVYVATGTLNDYECTQTAPCVVCERSPCKFDVDCHPFNTISMSGSYYPACTCVCKPGYYGTRCEKEARVNQGPYESLYHYYCPATPMSVTAGRQTCRDMGVGWDLATVPTMKAQLLVNQLIPQVSSLTGFIGWLGLADLGHEGVWQYTAGRLSGKTYSLGPNCTAINYDPYGLNSTIFNHCWWFPGEPNNANTENSPSEDCGSVWNMTDGTINDYECTLPVACTVCERSPCKFDLDCHPLNTVSMNGSYFPNCSCVCKPSYYGTHCEHQMTVDQGPYFSQYHYYCPASGAITYPEAYTVCRSLGAGWDLGTIPTVAAQQAVITMIPYVLNPQIINSQYAWLALTDAPVEGFWRWTAGRLANSLYSKNETCMPIPFDPYGLNNTVFNQCWWNIGEPNNQGEEDCGMITSTQGLINDYPCEIAAPLPCALCERSFCEMGVDCHPLNTASMSGTYYPDCSCKCKPSYWGAHCEKQTVVDHGPYVSEYEFACSAGSPLSWSASKSACQVLGTGWDIATFPTLASYNAIIERNQTAKTWIGGSDTDVEGSWKWMAGRLMGKEFYSAISLHCQSILLDPFNKRPYAFTNQCPWYANEPDNSGGSEDCAATWTTVGTIGDADCSQGLQCYACERSPCKLGIDCHALNTLTMSGDYFPHCTCTCRPGAGGEKCQYPYNSPTITVHPPHSTSSSLSLETTTSQNKIVTETSGFSPSISAIKSESNQITISPIQLEPSDTLRITKTLGIMSTPSELSSVSSVNSPSLFVPRSTSLEMSPSRVGQPTKSALLTQTVLIPSPTRLGTNSEEKGKSQELSSKLSVSFPVSPTPQLLVTRSIGIYFSRTIITTPNSVPSFSTINPTSGGPGTNTGATLSTDGPSTSTGNSTAGTTQATETGTTDSTIVSQPSDVTSSTTPFPVTTTTSVQGNTTSIETSSSSGTNTTSKPTPISDISTPSTSQAKPTGDPNSNDTIDTLSTTAISPLTTTTVPAPIIFNAPDMDHDLGLSLQYAAAPEASIAASYAADGKCRRVEMILSTYAVLTPLHNAATSYAEVIGYNAALLVGTFFLGAATVISYRLYRRLTKHPDSLQRAGRKDDPLSAAASVRYPATFIHVFILLSHGTAVSAGMALGEGRAVAAGVAACIVLVLVTGAWCLALIKLYPERVVLTSQPFTPQQLARQPQGNGQVLLCTGVRPMVAAKLFGPVVAGLRFQGLAGPLIPMIVPLLIFVVSLSVSAAGACEHVAIALGALFCLYCLSICIIRPFLGMVHNAIEAFVSLLVAMVLLAFYFVKQDGVNGTLSDGENASLIILIAVSNLRYPIVLARALDLVLPKIGRVNSAVTSSLPAPEDDKSFSFVRVNEDDEDEFVSDEFVQQATHGEFDDGKGDQDDDEF